MISTMKESFRDGLSQMTLEQGFYWTLFPLILATVIYFVIKALKKINNYEILLKYFIYTWLIINGLSLLSLAIAQ